MAIRRFTREELLFLRNSPLVVKPENLPAIEQWIEYVYLEMGDGKREKLRIAHSESAQHTSNHDRHKSGDGTQRQQRELRGQKSGLGGGVAIEPSPMGSFSAGGGRPTLGTRSSTLRGANGGE